MNKKAVTSISTAILVAMTLLICAIGLFSILTAKEKGILTSKIIESVYIKEAQIKSLVSQGMNLQDAVKLVDGTDVIDKTTAIARTNIETDKLRAWIIYKFYVPEPNYFDLIARELPLIEVVALNNQGVDLKEIFYGLRQWKTDNYFSLLLKEGMFLQKINEEQAKGKTLEQIYYEIKNQQAE